MRQYWHKGVDIEPHGTGKYRNVMTTEDAAYQLVNNWPKNEGPAFERALLACITALSNTDTGMLAERARQAFIEAAHEAQIFIREK